MTHLDNSLNFVKCFKCFKLMLLAVLIIVWVPTNSYAEDEILSLDGARIRGNQELPNVLYLIPWKPPKVYSLEQSSSSPAKAAKLKMIDRNSFKRLVGYHQLFKSQNSDK